MNFNFKKRCTKKSTAHFYQIKFSPKSRMNYTTFSSLTLFSMYSIKTLFFCLSNV